MTAVQPAVFVLVDDASPVTQLDVGFEQADQIGQQDAVSLCIFQCFDELLGKWQGVTQAFSSSTVLSDRG